MIHGKAYAVQMLVREREERRETRGGEKRESTAGSKQNNEPDKVTVNYKETGHTHMW